MTGMLPFLPLLMPLIMTDLFVSSPNRASTSPWKGVPRKKYVAFGETGVMEVTFLKDYYRVLHVAVG